MLKINRYKNSKFEYRNPKQIHKVRPYLPACAGKKENLAVDLGILTKLRLVYFLFIKIGCLQ